MIWVRVFILLALFLAGTNSAAVTITASPNADDICQDLICDFQSALFTASFTDEDNVILLGPGVYHAPPGGYVFTSSTGTSLTVQGAGDALTILDGGGINPILRIDLSGPGSITRVVIRGITFQNGNSASLDGGGLFVDTQGADVFIEENSFISNASGLGGGGAFVSTNTGYIELFSNLFLNNDASLEGGGAWLGTNTADLVAVNNIFEGNTADNLINLTPGLGGGIYLETTIGAMIMTNNTLVDNTAKTWGGGAYFYAFGDIATAEAYNNLLWVNTVRPGGSGADLFFEDDGDINAVASEVVAFYNLLDDLSIEDGSNLFLLNNFFENPLILFDYSLDPLSPARNAGLNTATALPVEDFAGELRVREGTVDIGALEYQPMLFPRGDGEGCFIATAAFGSYLHEDVEVLRDFRDQVLLKSGVGRLLVKTYYENSPPVAAYIAEHESARLVTRWLLTPVVYTVKYPIPLSVIFALLVGLGVYRWRRIN